MKNYTFHVRGIFAAILLILFLISGQAADAQNTLWGMTSAGGNQFGTIFNLAEGSSSLSFEYNFSGAPGSSPLYSSMILASDGKLYGMTYLGGIYNGGVIFQYDPSTNIYTKKVDFSSAGGINPRGSLVQASDGNLYGMTTLGGANNGGVIFQYNPATGIYTKEIDLASATGYYPFGSLVQATDGKLYGMTNNGGANGGGVIFQYNFSTNTYTKKIDLASSTGISPYGSLMQATDGNLYGMTSSGGSTFGGVIFQYNPVTNTYTKKIDLTSTIGDFPYGSLMQATDGNLYGMTSSDGIYSGGVIFQYNPSSNTYTKKIDLSTASGEIPYGSLTQASNGKMYGVTNGGGFYYQGVVFQYDPVANSYSKKTDLTLATGDLPYGSLVQAGDGKLYGLTNSGGAKGTGVVFQFDPSSFTYTKKIDLSAAPNGDSPNGSLIKASNGKLYGLTRYGGANSAGVIFQLDTAGNTVSKKIDMDSAHGDYSRGSLLQATDGKLYGMTAFGGATDDGVIFQYDPSSNTYTKKIDLSSANGNNPFGTLVQATDGKMYGFTYNGGANGWGTLFQYDPVANTYAKKFDMDSVNGDSPYGSLMQASNDKLYGMVSLGGANNAGVIIQYDPVAGTYTKKIDLTQANGASPYGSLLQASDGKLYGLTYSGGANNAGVIFQYDPVANTYTKKIDLTTTSGSNPYGSLIQGSNGKMYGTTSAGGANGAGVIFQYDPVANTYTDLFDFNNTNGSSPLGNLLEMQCPIPAAAGSITGSSSVCAGSVKTYSISTVSGASGYIWTVPAGAVINSGQNTSSISVTLGTTSGNISVTPSNSCGSGTPASFAVTVNPSPTVGITTSPSSTVCSGASVTLSGTGATSYSWSGSVTNGVSFTPASSATYTVTGTSNGCSSTSTVTITVNALPTVGATASPSTTICPGSSVTLSGTGATSYGWSSGVTNGVSFVPAATATYTVTGTAATGCSNTNTITVAVNSALIIGATATPSSAVCTGSSVTLSGTGATSYSWSGGVTNGVSFVPSSTGTYTVTGTSNGCSGTGTMTITVNPLPTVGVITSPSSTVCSGTSVTLSGTGATSYIWSGGITNGVAFTASATTTYTVTGTGANGCSNTNTATITVNPLPTVGATASPSSTVCLGSSITLSGTGATTYSWTGGVSNGVSFVPSSTTTYTVTGTGANGCTNTYALTVTVNELPTVSANASPSSSVCTGSSVTLSGTGATTYIWSGSATNGVSFVPSSTTTYTVTGTSSGCSNTSTLTVTVNPLPTVGANASPSSTICAGSSVTLSGTGAITYIWSGGVTNGVSFTPPSTATYTVTGTAANGCSNTNTITVTVNALPSVGSTASPSSTVCLGSSVTLSGTGATSYTWSGGINNGVSFVPASTNTYTVTGTGANGCSNTSTKTVTVNIPPTVGSTASPSSTICMGSSVTLNGTGATSYNWSGGVTNAVPFVPSSTTTYTVTGTTSGCTGTGTITITVKPLPTAGANATPSSAVCTGSSVTLSGTGATTYSWSAGVTNGTPFVPSSTITYTVTGTGANGCSNTNTITVTVNPLPTVGATAAPSSTICSGSSVTLSGTGATTYIWSRAVTNGVPFTLSATTTYTVTGTDLKGCSNTDTIKVNVNPLPSVGAAASPSSAVCLGSSVTLSGSGAVSYSWSNGVTNAAPFEPFSTITYTVTGTAANGCSNTDTITVKVNTALAAPDTIFGPLSVCIGSTATYFASQIAGATSYTWTMPSGWTGTSITDSVNTISTASGGTITVTANNACGSSSPQTLDVATDSLPSVGATASPSSIVCSGSSVTLNGTGATTYIWTGGVTDGNAFTLSSTATYSVTGTGANGCTNSTSVTITANPLPAVGSTASPSSTICTGASVTLNGTGGVSYIWSGGVLDGVSFIPPSTATYSVTGTDANGCSNTDTITITLSGSVASLGAISGSYSICAGTLNTYSVAPVAGVSSYIWTLPSGWTGASTADSINIVPSGTGGTISVIAVNGCGNSTPQILDVIVNASPTVGASASPLSTVCKGSSVTLNGTGATNYSWSGSVTDGVPFTPSSTTTYTVTGTSSGCSSTDTITVTVQQLPTVGIITSPASTICSGASVTLNGTGAASYSWSESVTNGTPFTPLSTNTYIVTGTGAGGCTNTDTVTVTVNPLSNVGATASPSATICEGSSVSLSGTGATSYSWSDGITNGVSFTPSSSKTYTVTGTGANGCTNTASIMVTVNQLPTIGATASPSSAICSGASVTLSGTGATSYSWSGGITNGVSFKPASTIIYTVIGTLNGCSNTDTLTVTILQLPTVGIITSPSSTVCSGASVTLNGTGASSYIWSGGITNGVVFKPSSSNSYTVTGTSADGCTNTDTLTLTVNPLPTVGATASPSPTICQGSSVSLSGTGATSYSWSGGITNGVSFTPSSTNTYTVTGTGANGCTNTDSIMVTVNQLPTVGATASPSSTICSGASLSLNGTGATTYTWSGGVTNGVSFTPSSTTTYTVTGTSNGCSATNTITVTVLQLPTVGIITSPSNTICSGASVTLSGTGASSYSWSGSVTNGASFTPLSTNTYTVTGTGAGGCTNIDTVTVTVNPLPNVGATASPSATICEGSLLSLSGTGAITYSWSDGITNGVSFTPSSSNTYTVEGTGANGCSNIASIMIIVNQLPKVNATASPSSTVCSGASVTLSGTGATIYSWSGGISNGVSFTPSSTGTYTVTGTSNGCSDSNTITVTVLQLPTVEIITSPASIVCSGALVTLSGTGATSFSWSGAVTNGVSFAPSSTNTYTVTGTSAGGCSNTDTVTITVNPLPTVAATVTPSATVCEGSSVTLNGNGAITYIWTDGITNGVSFTPSSTNTYTVTGTGTNGCTNTDSITVTAAPFPNIIIQPTDQIVNSGSDAHFITSSIPGAILQWQLDEGSGFVNLTDTGQYSGVTTDTLSISGAMLVQNNYKFRCAATAGICSDTTNTALLLVDTATAVENPVIDPDFIGTIYPNPAHDKLNILINKRNASHYLLKLSAINGTMVLSKEDILQEGSNLIKLNLENVSKGIYILSVTTDDKSKNALIVIE